MTIEDLLVKESKWQDDPRGPWGTPKPLKIGKVTNLEYPISQIKRWLWLRGAKYDIMKRGMFMKRL